MIFATTLNAHDHNYYDGKLHYQAERYTRYKMNLYEGDRLEFYNNFFEPRLNQEELLVCFTYTNGGIFQLKIDQNHPFDIIKPYAADIQRYNQSFDNLWDYYRNNNLYYINHHQSHAAYAFLSSKFVESDVLAIDGGGVDYCTTFFDKNHNKIDLSDQYPIGYLWNYSCVLAGYSPTHAGKLMGLSAYGTFNHDYYELLELFVDHYTATGDKSYRNISIEFKPEDIANTMQQYTLDKVKELVDNNKTCDRLCMAGGVAYNGYMNQMLTEMYDEVHIPPAVGDEGQALGTYMHADYVINNNVHVPSVYSGQDYDFDGDEKVDLTEIATAIANGKIIGWYQGKSESGNRALGNRSILADPRNPDIKNIINSTIKKREDYRPFAPSVLEDYYQEYFNTDKPSPYMSRIVPVLSDKIPGVTHIDGTARIQTVTREQNQRYYDLINEFYKITGIPMLLNTSFNCQEPIVETPDDALQTFYKTDLDLLVINDWVVRK